MSNLNSIRELHQLINNTGEQSEDKSWINDMDEVSDYESEEESDLDSGCESDAESIDTNEEKNQRN